MFNYAPKLWTTVPKDFTERKASLSHASQQTLFSSVFGSTVRVFILASAVCTGGWLGIRPHGVVERTRPAVFRSDAVPTTASRCGGNNSAAADKIPPGCALVDITPIGQDCVRRRTLFFSSLPKISSPNRRDTVADHKP
jgi:hypothetical protein